MAVSCPEVMYGAYYPYLYGRAGPSRPFYQYERFNQELYSSGGVPLAASSSTSAGSHSPCSPLLPSTSAALVAASTSNLSGASSSHATPGTSAASAGNSGILGLAAHNIAGTSSQSLPRSITKEEDLSGGARGSDTEGNTDTFSQRYAAAASAKSHSHASMSLSKGASLPGTHNESSCSSDPESNHAGPSTSGIDHGTSEGRATYLSATCVVFTNYSGDSSSVVDDHFTRALNFSEKSSKEGSSPMSTRNFPPSFWDSNYVPPIPTHPQVPDLYSTDGGYSTDPWVPHAAAAHYGSYAHAAHAAHAYHHNMAQYGSLLRLPQQYGHSSSFTNRLHHDQQSAAHAFEASAAAYSSYPSMAGLEAQVQESSKDLYWF
ncbi:protein vestigial [Culicoides brevitarsis]|uniref:protein vestigial n=1 Tax=Culicoides brevitarsis TaxID=469753 RepID=UPI00307B888C